MTAPYKAMVSTDWNGCLAPCGPFDCISFVYPELSSELAGIFRLYTGNRISLGEAAGRVQGLLPAAVTADQMDAYLAESFITYTGVPDLIEWCSGHDVLFLSLIHI